MSAILPSRRILIVEDDESIRSFLATVAKRLSMSVTTASNGAEAIDLLEKGEQFCAIVLDLMMPHVDGYAVLRHLRSTFSVVPVVVVTAVAPAQRSALDPLLVKAVVFKPFDIDKLQAAIEAACEPPVAYEPFPIPHATEPA